MTEQLPSTPDPTDARAALGRRQALKLLGGLGLLTLAGCASASKTAGTATTLASAASTTTTTASPGATEAIPEETAGPFPGDGTNGPNVLNQDGIVRRDIRSSFGSYRGTAAGVPLTVDLTVVDASTGKPMEGAAVYLWHCDREGRYSLYSSGVTDQNYLRGVQAADADGALRFTSIFPAAYDGRWPHIHFEVYASEADATGNEQPVATSQLVLPEATCDLVYATTGYEASVSNLARTSLTRDMVFSDGADTQTPTIAGDVSKGFTAALTVPV